MCPKGEIYAGQWTMAKRRDEGQEWTEQDSVLTVTL